MMAHNETPPFDAKAFAATYGGVTITKYQANSIVFAQGDAADCVFLHPARQSEALSRLRTRQGSGHRSP
jgi:hypothetical protein